MLFNLPGSLLAVSFAFLSFAAPAPAQDDLELLVLKPDNFESTVANGVWLVEHFSPYCHHCREFAPTWADLTRGVASRPDPGISLAQINCAEDGDLCDQHQVKGYPQINLYRNGEFVEVYKGKNRDFPTLQSYIFEHAETGRASQPPQAAEEEPDVNPDGAVLRITTKNFKEIIDQGPVFIKFFAPWCGHCKKLAPIWTQLGRHMQNKLTIAEVDCEENKGLCSAEGITGFPMLWYYKNGVKTEYTGGRKIEQLKTFTEKASAPGVVEIQPTELNEKIAEDPVVYLYLHETHDVTSVANLKQAATVLLSTPRIYTSSAPELFSRFAITASTRSALLVFKDNDDSAPTAVLNNPVTESNFKPWLLGHRLPTALELTQDSFQEVMNAPNHPLVMIATTSSDGKSKWAAKMVELGKKWRLNKGAESGHSGGDDVVFAWMDSERWESWLKSMYGVTDEKIIIADHKQLVYWDEDANGLPLKPVSTTLFAALEGALAGTLAFKNSENIVERTVRHINSGVQSFERYIANNPRHVIFAIVVFFGLLFYAIRRAMADEEEDVRPLTGHSNGGKKRNRLD